MSSYDQRQAQAAVTTTSSDSLKMRQRQAQAAVSEQSSLDNHKIEEHHAQVTKIDQTSLDYIKTRIILSFHTKAKLICGCHIITEDGAFLVIDYKNTRKSIIGIDSDGKQSFIITTAPYRALDMTFIDDTTIAVTSGLDKVVSIVDISSGTLNKHISVGYDCYGVSYREGTLFVCAAGQGIMSINLTSEKISTLLQCEIHSFSYITTHIDKLYFTDHKTGTLTCCNIQGNIIWTFKDDAVIGSPRGITTDNEGRVHVCDSLWNEVIVMSNDGKKSKTIISVDDGITSPYVLHFDKKRNNRLVTNTREEAFLFHISCS